MKEVETLVESKKVTEGKRPVEKNAPHHKSVPAPPIITKQRLTRDRPIKSIVKAITWRIIASATTFGLAYLFFYKDPYAAQKATGIALTEAFIKMLLYFFHERLWERVRWGRMMVIIRRGTRKSTRSIRKIMLRKS